MHNDALTAAASSPSRSRVERAGRRARARRRRSIDVKVLLLLLPLLVAIPLLAFGGFLLYVTAQEAGAHARREQGSTQAALRSALVGELEHIQQVLEVLASSLEPGERGVLDAARAASLAEGVVRADLGVQRLAFLDGGGAVVAEYPARDSAQAQTPVQPTPEQLRVFDTGRAAISDLHQSPLDGRLTASIDVPVWRAGRVSWVVTGQLDPVHLTQTLAAQVGAADALSTVLDSHRRILARTRDLRRYYGAIPSAETLQALDSGDRGWRRFRTLDANAFLWAWSTIPNGWTVWLGSPAREFDEALRTSMLRLAAVGLAVLLVAMAATWLLARRIAGSVRRLAESARRLTEGERPPHHASGIRQLDELYETLEDAHRSVGRALADRKDALDAERAARAIADEHNRSKDLFLGMLSHELRNPLAPIRASVYLLKRVDPGSAQARHAQVVIDRQSEHLTRIVDDLLDVTRIARGKVLLHKERIDLREVVGRAAEDARLGIEQRGVTLHVELPPHALWAEADPTRVAQMLGNLLHNASKFTHAGDVISVGLRRVGGAAELGVRDTGAGIDPELLTQLFDPFVQGKRTLARSEGGLGLGLALVKGLVELHGGSVRAHSEGVGKGAEFVVALPVAAPAAADRERPASVRAAAEPRRVLVVDDNTDAAESLAELVGFLGHRVEVAYDGPSAIEASRRWRPDVVLCDIGLPGMTGYEVARTMRAIHRGGVRLVALSGYTQPEDVARALESGFDRHVAKPPDPANIEGLLA